MYVANAWKQTKRSKKDDSEITAGAPKVSTITARSKSELKELGERMGWTPGPRSMQEITEMPSQRLLWEEAWNGEHYKAALELPAKLGKGKEIDSQWRAKRFWDDTAGRSVTPDEYKALTAEFKKFVDTYPQYRTTHVDENNDVLFGWLKDRHMAPVYSNLVLAFESCALAGRLWLNPSAIAAGSETDVLGTQHHNFHLLIQPQRRYTDDGLSADEFFEKNKDVLADKRTPPLIAQRKARADATAAHFAQTDSHTAKSGTHTVVDYPQEQRGVPPESEKYSFKVKVRSMSSTELAQRCQDDPEFKKALDEMK